MTRSIRALLFATGTAAVLGFPAAAQTIPVTLGGEASSLVGVDFDVPVQADMTARPERLGSFAIRVSWNPAILQFVSASAGSFGNATINDSSSIGVLRIAGVNPLGVTGRVILGVGRFRPLTAAGDLLRITVLELYASGTYADLRSFAQATDRAYCNGLGRWGDLDRDNLSDSRDALLTLTASVGLPTPGVDAVLGDVDENGVTNARDALAMLAHGIGLPTPGFRILAVAAGACGTPVTPPLALEPGDVTMLPTQTMTYYVTAIDPAGNATSVAGLNWVSSNLAVATVGTTGLVTAVAPGTAVIKGRTPADSVQATVTVVANRTTHWVDALAFNARNRLGTAALPFSTVAAAMLVADAGDTVRLRSARYPETVTIPHSLTLVGDTTAGGSRPLIVGEDGDGVVVTGGVRVVIRDVRFDTLTTAIRIDVADTVVIRNAEFRGGASDISAVFVDQVGGLFVQQSLFRGAGAEFFFSDNGIYIDGSAGLVVVDSSLFTDYGDHPLYASDVDSLVVRGSTIRNNYGIGIYVCGSCNEDNPSVVLSRNRFVENASGHVYVDGYQIGALDHNVTDGGGYTGFTFYGYGTSRLSLRGDSIVQRDDYWLYASDFDSLSLDSVTARAPDGYAYATGGRIVTINDSKFLELTDEGLEVDGNGPATSSLVIRNTEFRGPTAGNCAFCGEALAAFNVAVDAEDLVFDYLDAGIEVSDGTLDLRNAVFTAVYSSVEVQCGSASLNNVDVTGAYGSGYGVEFDGCESETDTLSVEGSSFTDTEYGIYANYGEVFVRNSAFSRNFYPIYVYNQSATITDNTFDAVFAIGFQAYPFSGRHVSFLRNTGSCLDQASYFFYGNHGVTDTLTVANNVFTGCHYGVYVTGNGPAVIRGNTIAAGTPRDGYGIFVSTDSTVRVVSNTVTGWFNQASIQAGSGGRRLDVDSNTVTGGAGAGIVVGGADSMGVRDNVITDQRWRCCSINQAAIAMTNASDNATAALSDVRRNRIFRSLTHGIIVRRAFGDTVTVTVDSNAIRGVDSTGIFITEWSKALVRYNAVDSNLQNGVLLSQFAGVVPAVVQFNNLTRNGLFGVSNVGTPLTDATNNWWGDVLGPRCLSLCSGTSVGDSVSGNVSFTPFLTAPALTPAPAPPSFAAVARVPAVPTARALAPARGGAVGTRPPAARQAPRIGAPPRYARPASTDAARLTAIQGADRLVDARQASRESERRVTIERRAARAAEQEARRDRFDRDRAARAAAAGVNAPRGNR